MRGREIVSRDQRLGNARSAVLAITTVWFIAYRSDRLLFSAQWSCADPLARSRRNPTKQRESDARSPVLSSRTRVYCWGKDVWSKDTGARGVFIVYGVVVLIG